MIQLIALLVALLGTSGQALAGDVRIDFEGMLSDQWGSLVAGTAISGTLTGNASNFDAQPRRLALTVGVETIFLAIDPSESTGDGLVVGFHNDTDIFVTDPDVPGDVFEIYAYFSGFDQPLPSLNHEAIGGFTLFLFDVDGTAFENASFSFGVLDLRVFESASIRLVAEGGVQTAQVTSVAVAAVPLPAALPSFLVALGFMALSGRRRFTLI